MKYEVSYGVTAKIENKKLMMHYLILLIFIKQHRKESLLVFFRILLSHHMTHLQYCQLPILYIYIYGKKVIYTFDTVEDASTWLTANRTILNSRLKNLCNNVILVIPSI